MGWKSFEWRLWTWFCAPSVSLVTAQQALKKDIVFLWQKLQTDVSMWMQFFVICPDGQLKVSGFLKRVFDLKPKEAWEAVGLATSSVSAWKKLGSQDFQVWVVKDFLKEFKWLLSKEWGTMDLFPEYCTVAWVDLCIKESEKNHVHVWEQEHYTVLWFMLWC